MCTLIIVLLLYMKAFVRRMKYMSKSLAEEFMEQVQRYIDEYNMVVQRGLQEVKNSRSYSVLKTLKNELATVKRNYILKRKQYFWKLSYEERDSHAFFDNVHSQEKEIAKVCAEKVLDEFEFLVKKYRFSFFRKIKIQKYISKNLKLNDSYKTDSDSYINCETGVSKIILKEPDFFINLSKKNSWLGTTILDSVGLFYAINGDNYEEILEIYKKCNPKFTINSREASKICFINGIQNYSGWNPEELETIQEAYNIKMMSEGFNHPECLPSFLKSLNAADKVKFKENYKNIIHQEIVTLGPSTLISSIEFLEKTMQVELLEEVLNILQKSHETYSLGIIDDFLVRLYNASPTLIEKHKDFFLPYVDVNVQHSSAMTYWDIIDILKESGIKEVNEDLIGNRKSYIERMVAIALDIDVKNIGEYSSEVDIVESIINELLSFQNMECMETKCIGVGLTFNVYEMGDYVLKLGDAMNDMVFMNDPSVLQPLIRGFFGRIFIEVQPKIRTSKLDFSKIEQIRRNLKKNGIIYDDLGENQFGVIDKPVQIFRMKNGQPLPHLNQNLGFFGNEVGNGELTEDMYQVGQYYILDTGCLLGREEPAEMGEKKRSL